MTVANMEDLQGGDPLRGEQDRVVLLDDEGYVPSEYIRPEDGGAPEPVVHPVRVARWNEVTLQFEDVLTGTTFTPTPGVMTVFQLYAGAPWPDYGTGNGNRQFGDQIIDARPVA